MGRYTSQGRKNSKRWMRKWPEGFHRWVWLWTRGSRSYQQPWALTESDTTEQQSWSRFCPPPPSIAQWLATVSLQQMFSLIISKLWLWFIIMLCYSHVLYLCYATVSSIGAGTALHILTNLYVSLTRHSLRVSHGNQMGTQPREHVLSSVDIEQVLNYLLNDLMKQNSLLPLQGTHQRLSCHHTLSLKYLFHLCLSKLIHPCSSWGNGHCK